MLKSTPQPDLTELPDVGPPTVRMLFDSEESNLLRFVYSLTGRRAVAEEIVQEIFLQLHARMSEVRDPRAWLFRSARNRALHYLQKSRRECLVARDDATGVDPVSDACAQVESPEELMAHAENVARLRMLLSQLPEKDRKLVQLKYYEGLKYRDISQRTGLTVSNVGFRLHQVIKKLASGLCGSERSTEES